MGFRFRKSFKIAPGVRWNVRLRGSSLSIGGRGATLNVSKRGTPATYSIPGTGISYSKKISGPAQHTRTVTPEAVTPDADALGIPFITWRRAIAVVSLGPLVVWPLVGLIGLAVAAIIPSRTTLAARELARRTAMLQGAAPPVGSERPAEDVDFHPEPMDNRP